MNRIKTECRICKLIGGGYSDNPCEECGAGFTAEGIHELLIKLRTTTYQHDSEHARLLAADVAQGKRIAELIKDLENMTAARNSLAKIAEGYLDQTPYDAERSSKRAEYEIIESLHEVGRKP